MWENIDEDRHFLGEFYIDDEVFQGEILYNKESGIILLSIRKETREVLGNSYGTISLIKGKLHSGSQISLYHNRCIKNQTQLLAYQDLVFRSDYIVLGPTQASYNRLICVVENGLQWSGLSQLDMPDFMTVKEKPVTDLTYHWFNANVTFSTTLENELFAFPRKEVSKIVERLIIEIDCDEKQSPAFFIQVRDKIMSLISFATKDNINIEEQFLVDFDDFEMLGNEKRFIRKSFLSSEPYCPTLNTSPINYNFTLQQLPDTKDLQDILVKLEPVFNLYLSLFKYQRMPAEMIFLNIVQALETFHSRFFYDDKKENYIESVKQRFENCSSFDRLKELLLSDTQMDENCRYIILASRLNDLLIGEFNGLFLEFYWDNNYAQTIADTRHYYTHYGKSKETKALRGDDLIDSIYILRLLLEYSICKILKIDIEQATRQQLANYFRKATIKS